MNPPELPSISIILTGHNEEYCIGDAIRAYSSRITRGR